VQTAFLACKPRQDYGKCAALAACRASGYMSGTEFLETDMIALFQTIDLALSIYTWIIIASAIFSWLYAFNVVNSHNQFVGMIGEFLFKATEPALRPIRRILPNFGGIDISPVILIFIIWFIQDFLIFDLPRYLG
jgi:YggT family protein